MHSITFFVVLAGLAVAHPSGLLHSRDSTPSAETCNCYLKLNDCQGAPNANQAQCSADFASCVGSNPYNSTDVQGYFNNLKQNCPSVSPSTTTSASAMAAPTPDAESCNCYLKLDDCQAAPNANQAECSAEFSGCINYNPYNGTDAQINAFFAGYKKSCPSTFNTATTTTMHPTASVTAAAPTPDAESCNCYLKLNDCQTASNANQAQCSAEFSGCINYNPYNGTDAQINAFFADYKKSCPSTFNSSTTASTTSSAVTAAPSGSFVPDAETCNCFLKLGDCQTGDNANQATCSSDFANCLGYSPYNSSQSAFFDALKRYCSTAPDTTTTQTITYTTMVPCTSTTTRSGATLTTTFSTPTVLTTITTKCSSKWTGPVSSANAPPVYVPTGAAAHPALSSANGVPVYFTSAAPAPSSANGVPVYFTSAATVPSSAKVVHASAAASSSSTGSSAGAQSSIVPYTGAAKKTAVSMGVVAVGVALAFAF